MAVGIISGLLRLGELMGLVRLKRFKDPGYGCKPDFVFG